MRSKPRGIGGAVCAMVGAAEPIVARVAAASEARMRDIAAIPLKAARVVALRGRLDRHQAVAQNAALRLPCRNPWQSRRKSLDEARGKPRLQPRPGTETEEAGEHDQRQGAAELQPALKHDSAAAAAASGNG